MVRCKWDSRLRAPRCLPTLTSSGRRGTGRNVLARLPAGSEANDEAPVVILGAHIDHLGRGGSSNSLAREDEQDQVHVGADDNASGVAAMLEIAQYLAAEKRSGRLKAKRDFVVAAWSGEELGLFGSQAFVDDYYELFPHAAKNANASSAAHATSDGGVANAQAHGDSSRFGGVDARDRRLSESGHGRPFARKIGGPRDRFLAVTW